MAEPSEVDYGPVPDRHDLNHPVYANTWVGDRRLTWREAYESEHAKVVALSSLDMMARDLTRCEHGRCAGDTCGQCGGPSKGNPVTRDSGDPLLIGYDMGGRPYEVPPSDNWMNGEPYITRAGKPYWPPPG